MRGSIHLIKMNENVRFRSAVTLAPAGALSSYTGLAAAVPVSTHTGRHHQCRQLCWSALQKRPAGSQTGK